MDALGRSRPRWPPERRPCRDTDTSSLNQRVPIIRPPDTVSVSFIVIAGGALVLLIAGLGVARFVFATRREQSPAPEAPRPASRDAQLIFDHNAAVRSVNPAFAAMCGRTARDMSGEPVQELFPELARVSGAAVGETLVRETLRPSSSRRTWRLKIESGDTREVELAVVELTTRTGRMFRAGVRDVSHRRQLATICGARQVRTSPFLGSAARTALDHVDLLEDDFAVGLGGEDAAELRRLVSAGRPLLMLLREIAEASSVPAAPAPVREETLRPQSAGLVLLDISDAGSLDDFPSEVEQSA